MLARGCQVYADRLPILMIVIMHVVPPAMFAVVHGSVAFGRRGMAVFSATCLGVGSCAELLSLGTGFPFGNYHFTAVMGPHIFDVPVLLALAYLGIGYCAWIMALQILGYADRSLSGASLVSVPLLASSIMTAWDLAMDPDWATLDHAWIWHSGGVYFGVPISNFFGWFGTACVYYFAFAFYIGPCAGYSDVGFVNPPRSAGSPGVPANPLVQFRSIAEHPTANGGMVYAKPALCHQFLQVP
jgi:putative membrane protein